MSVLQLPHITPWNDALINDANELEFEDGRIREERQCIDAQVTS